MENNNLNKENIILDNECVDTQTLMNEQQEASNENDSNCCENKEATDEKVCCLHCGFVLEDNQMFCPKCGTARGETKTGKCSKCGAEIVKGQAFCSNCGEKIKLSTEDYIDQVKENSNTVIKNIKANKKKYGIIAVAVIVTVFVLYALLGTKDFNQMYGDLKGRTWCTIASDGTWMQLDTNPFNEEDGFELLAWSKIKSVLNDLNFPSSVAEEMNQTRSLDGRQSASTDKYEVSWSYHPDNGLEALFKLKK